MKVWITVVISLSGFLHGADVPSYWLLPDDGYRRPNPLSVKLNWEKLPPENVPAEILDDMDTRKAQGKCRGFFQKGRMFSIVRMDLNDDGIPDWIVNDERGKENGETRYWCYFVDRDGIYRRTGCFAGSTLSVLEPRNGYRQFGISTYYGMAVSFFAVYAFEPQDRKYRLVRRECHDYKNFTCKIEGRVPGEHSRELLFSRLETALRTAAGKSFGDRLDQNELTFSGNGFRYSENAGGFSLFIAGAKRRYKPGAGSIAYEYPLTAYGFSGKSLYLVGKDKYRALWTELLHWLNVRMPVWYSDWFRRLLPNMDGAGRDEFGIYLGTLADHSQYFRGMSSHPFINYVLLDAIDLATGVPLARPVFLAFEAEAFSELEPGERIAVYTRSNPMRGHIQHVKLWFIPFSGKR